MTAPEPITGLRHRVDHIDGGVPRRTPELAFDFDAEHFAFDVERKLDGAADATAVALGRALSTVLAQTPEALAAMTAAGYGRIGPFNTVQDLTATLTPGQGYSYRLRPVNAAGETGDWTAWLTGVVVAEMGVPAIDALFDSPPATYPAYAQPVANRGGGGAGGAAFPSHRLGVLHLMAWNGQTNATRLINMGLGADTLGDYDMAGWFRDHVDPLGDLGLYALHIFRGPWGANLYATDAAGTGFAQWNLPGGVNVDGEPQVTGLMTPAEMIRRHGHDNTLFADVLTVGPGAFAASNYLVTWMTEVPARIAAGHGVHVYMAAPPRNAVSDDWLATIKSPLIAGIPLATGCSISMDTFSSLVRDETTVLAGLEQVNPAWLLLGFIREIGYQAGLEPPARRQTNPDIGGANAGPDLLHSTTQSDGTGVSRWQLFQRLAGGSEPTDFPGLDELLTSDGDRTGYACVWLQPNGIVPLNVNTPEDNLKRTLTGAADIHDYVMEMLAADEPRLFPVIQSHVTARQVWDMLDAAQREALLDAAAVPESAPADSDNPGWDGLGAWAPRPGGSAFPVIGRTIARGSRFRVAFPITAAEAGGGLPGVAVAAQVRKAPYSLDAADLVHTFEPTLTPVAGGQRAVLEADTAGWPVGVHRCDVRVSGDGFGPVVAFRVVVRVARDAVV